MDKSYFWTVILCLGVATLTIRSSFFFLYSKISIPEKLKKSFTYIPAAVLPALVTPAVFSHQGSIALLGGHERVLALCLAALICYFTKNVFITVASGLGLLFLITQL